MIFSSAIETVIYKRNEKLSSILGDHKLIRKVLTEVMDQRSSMVIFLTFIHFNFTLDTQRHHSH